MPWAGTGYGHMTIGTDADLSAATTADVKAFFDKYYVPNNAALVLVGDVDFADAKTKIEKYFGDIPRGPDRQAVRSRSTTPRSSSRSASRTSSRSSRSISSGGRRCRRIIPIATRSTR